jgi:FkbM family methyltransferase
MNIPIVIICYNNYRYVENTLKQILNINKEYYKNIIIVNNKSTCLDTINYLNSVDVNVINNINNAGPWIDNFRNKHIYDILPSKFILTDPDLEFNENIPSNFIEILEELSDKYQRSIGFALDISDNDKFYKDIIPPFNVSIYDGEKGHWHNRIDDDTYELYIAPIDTTFNLINKNLYSQKIRIAGNFTAKHLPWYIEDKIYINVYEKYLAYINILELSTTSRIIIKYINDNYLKINKNNEFFLIKNDVNNLNLSFWKNTYTLWDKDKFEVFDKYLSKDKIFIDIGGWIGTTAMYGSRKSKHVYSIEADNLSFNDMETNMKANCVNNYTLINKAIFNIDNMKIKFGKNMHLENSSKYYLTETITLNSIIKNFEINVNDISLINVNIAGGEENILDDLYDMHIKYGVSLYIKFHYSCWNDKNLDRFAFLSEDTKNNIISNPFISMTFQNTFQNI